MPNREFGVDSLYVSVFVTFSPAEKHEETIHKRLEHAIEFTRVTLLHTDMANIQIDVQS